MHGLTALATITLQDIGSYAGLAAVVGLAVLSALYFSQARDVKRLRDWAGRAPERAAEPVPGRAAAPAGAQKDAQPGQPAPAPGQPAPAQAGAPQPATAAGKA